MSDICVILSLRYILGYGCYAVVHGRKFAVSDLRCVHIKEWESDVCVRHYDSVGPASGPSFLFHIMSPHSVGVAAIVTTGGNKMVCQIISGDVNIVDHLPDDLRNAPRMDGKYPYHIIVARWNTDISSGGNGGGETYCLSSRQLAELFSHSAAVACSRKPDDHPGSILL